MTAVAASGGWTPPALDVPAAPAQEPLSVLFAVAFAVLVFLVTVGLSLLAVDVTQVARMHLEGSDGVVEKRWPVPPFRHGGLSLRPQPGTVAEHSHERGDA